MSKKIAHEDIPQNTKSTLKRLFSRLAKQKGKLMIVTLATLFSSAAYAVVPLAVGLAIDHLVQAIQVFNDPTKFIQTIMDALSIPVLIILIASTISGVLAYLQQYIIASVGEELTLSLRNEISVKLTKLPLRYFDQHQTGEIMSRISNDIEKVSSVMQVGLMQLISSIFTILITCGTMFYLSSQLFLIVLISVGISMIATAYVSTLSQRYYGQNMIAMGELGGKVEEVFSGNRVVKSFNQQAVMIDEIKQLNQKQFIANRKAQFADYAIYPSIRFINQLGFVATAIVGATMAIGGTLSVGAVQAFLQYVNQISEPVTQASYVITSLQAAIAGAERVFTLLDEEEERADEQNSILHVNEGRVLFQDVKFGYSEDRILIKKLNLEVKPNEMVAIVGPTGGGKTTLVNLLMRFYELNGGMISIDGHDITTMPRSEMRRKIGMVLQDAWLFEGSIADNIAYGKMDATRQEIIKAAKEACCDHFIRTLPNGYDTILSSEASGVSQGQMQLLTIARAMLSDPSILILDEATSSVDTRTEVEIQKAMSRLMRGKTSFVIAHRLSTIQSADVILVVRDGDVIERGNHQELLKQKGFYSELYLSQFEAA